ncbi:MAG TPA: helix-turn-helix transcriptional regulator [Pedobacter sp.]|uniref:helix-turn-helix domain-containing protein n=1 Tax=Pedobacter sp. TaxID=1411316 RepID=UPI002CC624F2|nr:helix-turn-helix transcriptional regulator [Pedobacter sp.]HMI02856.1 helix-turn-helix transcriptional regulator [Pedobacter sp.]
MNVINFKPTCEVAEYVERILVIENHQMITPFSLPLFANGLPTLLFKSTRGIINNRTTTHFTLFGQTILPETITFNEDFTIIAYFFKPYALSAVFDVSARELTDRPVDLNLVMPTGTTELQDRLLNADTVESMITLLDQFILHLLANSKRGSDLIKYAVSRIAGQPLPEISILLQKELHITEKTFRRTFEKNIGIAPNLYRRICQFNAAFQQLNNRNYEKLSDIAFQHGYADQSHYIRSFKEFTNITPKEYLNFGTSPENT